MIRIGKQYLLLIPLLLGAMACEGSHHSNVVTNPEIEANDSYRKGNSYQRDFLLFADMLKNTHPLFAENDKPHFDMDSLTQAGYRDLADCKSKTLFRLYLQTILSRLNDGHTSVSLNMSSLFRKGLYPFYLFFDNDTTFYLYGIKKEYADQLGKQVTSINGTPVREVLDSFRSLMSCDNDNQCKAMAMERGLLWKEYWDYIPYHRTDGKLLLEFEDGDSVLLPSIRNTKDFAWYETETMEDFVSDDDGMPFSYSILPEKQLCYLHFAQCTDRNTMLGAIKMGMSIDTTGMSTMPDFGTFLKEMFCEIAENEVKTLVIDVRDNGGGNSRLCDQLLSWLRPVDEIRDGGGVNPFFQALGSPIPGIGKERQSVFSGKRPVISFWRII